MKTAAGIFSFITAVIMLLTATPAGAQHTPLFQGSPAEAYAQRKEALKGGTMMPVVSLLTCDAGKDIYELEGHTSLRVNDIANRSDYTFNWGVFDFNSPNFLYRFVKGETDYMCVAYPTKLFIDEYKARGRRVTEQILDLDSVQTVRLLNLLAQNLLPENSTYRYNYVKDNCSTRPLGVIERALGDSLRFIEPSDYVYGYTGVRQESPAEPTTFRKEMTRYHAAYPWYQFGIDLALGSGIDKEISARERIYSPLFLHDMMSMATFGDRPIVASEYVLAEGTPGGTSLSATPWYLTPVAAAVYLLVITLIVSAVDFWRRKISRWYDSLLYGVMGLAGCLLTFLIFVSTHEATSPNWLFLWLNPLCFIPVVFEWIKSCKRVVYCYQFCNFAALIVLLAGHQFFGQALNPAFAILIVSDLIRSFTYIYLYKYLSVRSFSKPKKSPVRCVKKKNRR